MKTVIFHDAPGTIGRAMILPDDQAGLQAPPAGLTALVIDGAIDSPKLALTKSWINAGTLASRGTIAPVISAATIAADGTAEATISGLPDPCSVAIAGVVTVAATIVTGGTVVVTSTQPGALILNVTAEPSWIPWSSTINAV